MRKTLIANADASIYEAYPDINTGYDEILEIGKIRDTVVYGNFYVTASARSLVDFDITDSGSWNASSVYLLNLRVAYASELTRGQYLEIGHVSQSWVEGSGYFYQTPNNSEDGVTWNQLDAFTTWSNAGGDFDTAITASYILDRHPLEDLQIDVSTIMQPIVSESLDFNGLYIKIQDADEVSSVNRGVLKVFSSDTHTVYQPTLEVAWVDQVFVTGSLTPLVSSGYFVSADVKKEYRQGTAEQIRLLARDQYPSKRFDAIQRYRNSYYLPSESYYRVVDAQSNAIYGAFDQYNALHCDGTSSYFVLDTSPLYKNREYRIELEINFDSTLKTIIPISTPFFVR